MDSLASVDDFPPSKIRRALQPLGAMLFLASVSRNTKTFSYRSVEIPLARFQYPVYIALGTLGYPDLCRRAIFAKAEGRAQLAARVRIDYGDTALTILNIWQHYQALFANLNHASRFGGGIFKQLVDMIDSSAADLGILDQVSSITNELRTILTGPKASRSHARAARQLLVTTFQSTLVTQLGTEQRLQNNYTDSGKLSYPALYRYCILLFTQRATDLINVASATVASSTQLDTRSDFDQAQGRYELITIIERLGIDTLIPSSIKSVTQAIKALRDTKPYKHEPDCTEPWLWIDTYLGIVFGGCSAKVYELAYNIELFRLLASNEEIRIYSVLEEIIADINKTIKIIGLWQHASRNCVQKD